MNDQLWITLRYVLIGGGSYLAGRGKIPVADVPLYADGILQILSGGTALATVAWGLYVRYNTRAVPIATAERRDVPTVSAATGATQPGPSHT